MEATRHEVGAGVRNGGGGLSHKPARREKAFLDRQGYRLRLARDSLVRELTRVGGDHSGAVDLHTALTRRLGLRLLRNLRALEKIEEGTYGRCELTGGPIARSRLEQVPWQIETPEGRRLPWESDEGGSHCGP